MFKVWDENLMTVHNIRDICGAQMECEIVRRFGAESALRWTIYLTVVVKKELSLKVKILMYRPMLKLDLSLDLKDK